ncbi:NAD(P)/FAD-dependent oxidoreductase [Nocardiopsis sp. N85]|uniref:flavin monoamine oxidase family protein n=1 Tax=Nocardiopsis sp. N85 TaxID=3029400 RepID=UPI00237F5255|nr:NAD(P)/FAD-dependent oxidoreductase [Nocardiopsis sp. N85]MDE3722494.1 NAD(P)/FAD-dependent oxidoreductase [Nocardiopsis sp. N85]
MPFSPATGEPRWSRRAFLALGGGALLSASTSYPDTPPEWDVAVVGAGPAGLAAARNLFDHGLRVVVLEARDRVGGQVFTDRTFAPVPVESGAGLIHGADVSTWELVEETGARTERMRADWSEAPAIDVSRAPRGDEDAATYLRGLGVPEEDWPPVAIDGEPLERWSARWIHATGVFDWWSAPREDFRVVDGYDRLLEPLAAGPRIMLRSPARMIRRGPAGVEIGVAGRSTPVRARRCVVALPIGVLRSGTVRFEPGLPPGHREAVAALTATDAVKLLYRFDRPVMPTDRDSLGGDGFVFWSVSREPEVVTVWTAGDGARDLLAREPADRFAEGLRALSGALGGPPPAPVGRTTHDWTADVFSRGAYLHVPPGAHDAPATLAASVDRTLFFAGEAVTGENTVDGAYDSGYAVGDDLLADL